MMRNHLIVQLLIVLELFVKTVQRLQLQDQERAPGMMEWSAGFVNNPKA
jgi:hypothetical protein